MMRASRNGDKQFRRSGKISRDIAVDECAISSALEGVRRPGDRCDLQAFCRNFNNFGARRGRAIFSGIITFSFLP
jgi:hypothetical protein